MKTIILTLVVAMVLVQGHAATVWNGPSLTFTKPGGSDPTLAANQDRLNNDVWLTRGATRGLYNIKTELAYGDKSVSPGGTRWAFQGVDGNPNDPLLFSATNHPALTFESFANALGGQVGHTILGRKGVLHLVAQDTYLDIEFSAWGVNPGSGAGFSYARSTAPAVVTSDVPALPPWGLMILGVGLVALAVPLLKRQRTVPHLPLIGILIASLSSQLEAATIWPGPDITFTKLGNVDVNLAASQDRINDDVWLTRASSQAIFNIRSEPAYAGKSISPVGTEWAFLGLQGNTADASLFGAANYSSLSFLPFADALGGQVGPNIVGRQGVLHLIEADAYLNLTFNSYSSGSGGGAFSYTRATPVPEPIALPLCLALALAVSVLCRRRNRRSGN